VLRRWFLYEKRIACHREPAAGGGRAGKFAASALDRLRSSGIAVDAENTSGPGDATRIAREAYAKIIATLFQSVATAPDLKL